MSTLEIFYRHASDIMFRDTCKNHVDFITPGVNLLSHRSTSHKSLQKRRTAQSRRLEPVKDIIALSGCNADSDKRHCLKHCDRAITPACIAALYDIPPSAITPPNSSNVMGIYESEFQRWDQTDLDIFFANFTNGRVPKGAHPISMAIDGGRSEALQTFPKTNNGDEAALDLNIAYPIVYPQQIGIWDENDLHYQHWIKNDTWTWGFDEFLAAVDGSYCKEASKFSNIDPAIPRSAQPWRVQTSFAVWSF